MTEKRCTRCWITKPTSDFYPRKDKPIGIQAHCKQCDKARVKRYQLSENGKSVLLQYSRLPRVKKFRRKWRVSPSGKTSNRNSLRNRRRRDLKFRIKDNLRRRFNRALHGKVKEASVVKLLGCSIESFKIYIESLFEVGMSWENYGEWHIDHIIPCALFDMTKPEHQKRCFHVSNLQPLWGRDNISKGSRVTNPQLRLL